MARIISDMKHIYRIIVLCAVLVFAVCSCGQSSQAGNGGGNDLDRRYRSMVHSEFQDRVRRHNADSRYLIIVDYSIPSNKDRLFIWDAEQDRIIEKFWCAHGFGGGSTAEKPVFSNTYGSNCSSLGWFAIDKAVGVSARYGYKYHAVDGFDATNSNARQREILVHAWPSVSHDEAAKIDHPMRMDYRSAGCFTVSEKAYLTIDRYIKSRNKCILIWAIDGI